MRRACLAVALLLTSDVTPAKAAQAAAACDEVALGDAADTARSNIIAATDGAAAIEAWRHVLDSGGAIAWTATEYNVDPRSSFVFAFDREALRIYRAGALGEHAERATRGCVESSIAAEAVIPWSQVREIEAGNWVLWFRLREPVTIRSDRGKRRRVDELKACFQGAGGGDLTFYYSLTREGRIPFWNVDVYEVENFRGIAVGPTDFQRRLQFVIAQAVDPGERIAMKRKARGAGW
jgi:hypothetical protein